MRSILILMAAVAIAFVVVIWFGFWIHTTTNAVPDNVFGAVAYIAIFAIALFLGCWMLGISPWSGWTVAEMFGPRRVRRRPEPEGEWHPSATEIAYLSDWNATATCAHLQPIERAMRMAGLNVRRLEYLSTVRASCRINEAELRRVFKLPPSITYREGEDPDRGEYGHPRADIFCGYCVKTDRGRSNISVVPPQEARKDTPWFPSAP